MVVERGRARCPRCVATADYSFVEYEPNGVRYEVRCRKCGERYIEDLRPPVPGTALAVIEPPLRWPPDHEPVPPRDVRAEVAAHLAAAREHTKSGVAVVNRRSRELGERTRVWAADTRAWAIERRSVWESRALAPDHTGG
jgi:hypothetical protein